MSKLKITQTKSWIKCPKRQKDTLAGLGLGKIGRSVEHNATPQINGMVAKVAHLVKVEQL